MWRNWYTRTSKERVASALRVQVSPSALIALRMNSITIHQSSLAVVIISNGPGELSTWVKPIVNKLIYDEIFKKYFPNQKVSLNLVLVPCPNATGNEYQITTDWEAFDFISPAKNFWKLLLNPKKFNLWPNNGIVIFLGGDQFWSVALSARLKYKHISYIEWIARWPQWNDRIIAMNEMVQNKIPYQYKSRCKIVGDIMADLPDLKETNFFNKSEDWIAILPGSKKTKLSIGVPFLLETIDHLSRISQDYKFFIPLAPTTNLEEILYYQSANNKISKNYRSSIIKIIKIENDIFEYLLYTKEGTQIFIKTSHPSHEILTESSIAITTIGANTAELAALKVPMIVILPTQDLLDIMNAWDGFLGTITKIPFIKIIINYIIIKLRFSKTNKLAWPNIRANKIIVPERIGNITPHEIAEETNFLLKNKEILIEQKYNLSLLRGGKGAINQIIKEIINLLKYANQNK